VVEQQRIMLTPPPSGPVISRPLKTGAAYTLVLPKRRLVYRHWDKDVYRPGEVAELTLEGEGLAHERFAFVVERASTVDGPWKPVATIEADVSADKATARFTIPNPTPAGKLTQVEWKQHKAGPGTQIPMHVAAEGYEGGSLSIEVEKRNQRGEWEVCSRWQGEIENGRYDTVFAVPQRRER
jgi:hypothetical protein